MSLRNEVEALLFAAGKYMPEEEIAELLGQSKPKTRKALEELQQEYKVAPHSLRVMDGGGNWKMNVKEEFLPVARKIISETELEKPVLETLAVVAWKRPILQSEVISIRGTHAYEHIHFLLDQGFITREKQGRTYKVKLAEKFFDYFDVEGDQDIRSLFADVKRPEPKEEKLGKLEVVDLEKEKEEQKQKDLEQGKLGNLEIVENVNPYEKWKVDTAELDEIDEELDKISERTSEKIAEIDEFKPSEEESEEIGETSEDEQPAELEKDSKKKQED